MSKELTEEEIKELEAKKAAEAAAQAPVEEAPKKPLAVVVPSKAEQPYNMGAMNRGTAVLKKLFPKAGQKELENALVTLAKNGSFSTELGKAVEGLLR